MLAAYRNKKVSRNLTERSVDVNAPLRGDDKKTPAVVAGRGGSNKISGSASKYKVDDSDSAVSMEERANPKPNSTTTTLDCNGFSHLEWSASVPYNLAEEPDEVRCCPLQHGESINHMLCVLG